MGVCISKCAISKSNRKNKTAWARFTRFICASASASHFYVLGLAFGGKSPTAKEHLPHTRTHRSQVRVKIVGIPIKILSQILFVYQMISGAFAADPALLVVLCGVSKECFCGKNKSFKWSLLI